MRPSLLMCVAAFIVLGSGGAQALTAAETAARMAKKRGYTPTQTACMVQTFERYASLNRRGKWTIAGGKRRSGPGNAYRADLQSNCGISR
jgi:hypothetical protein